MMANRRMFSLDVVDTDKFLDMPLSTQSLYFHLGMHADDDGFVSAPKKITKMLGCGDDDLKLLLAKGYLISFDSGIVVLTHWKQNNTIQKDRYSKTRYIDELNMLSICDDKSYILGNVSNMYPKCIQDVSTTDTQTRLDKNRQDKNRQDKTTTESENSVSVSPSLSNCVIPSFSEVKEYIQERGYRVDPQKFWECYDSLNWKIDGKPIKNWRAVVRGWDEKRPIEKVVLDDKFYEHKTDQTEEEIQSETARLQQMLKEGTL